jgi:hypothetical protein
MDLEVLLELKATQWHDGRLQSLSYSLASGLGVVLLKVTIYASEEAPERHHKTFRFVNVSDIVMTAKASELQANDWAGNIIQARLHISDQPALSIYLTGGYVRLVAERVESCE